MDNEVGKSKLNGEKMKQLCIKLIHSDEPVFELNKFTAIFELTVKIINQKP